MLTKPTGTRPGLQAEAGLSHAHLPLNRRMPGSSLLLDGWCGKVVHPTSALTCSLCCPPTWRVPLLLSSAGSSRCLTLRLMGEDGAEHYQEFEEWGSRFWDTRRRLELFTPPTHVPALDMLLFLMLTTTLPSHYSHFTGEEVGCRSSLSARAPRMQRGELWSVPP